jgi:transcriptional regulator with XRE-family HTH domain
MVICQDKNEVPMKFKSERLIKIREQLGINKAEAARKLNMSAMGYGRYENGQREPSFQTVCFIASAFNTTSDYLYGLTDNPSPSSITISSSGDPELFAFINSMQKDKNLEKRILTYFSKLTQSEN